MSDKAKKDKEESKTQELDIESQNELQKIALARVLALPSSYKLSIGLSSASSSDERAGSEYLWSNMKCQIVIGDPGASL
ncbi:hypothetical protein A3H85_01000 [Candidatus Daviesbacteria bacterium RIFCSPLOWO2_02_FULL_40_8]|nr:MAG: hypothetical protein A3H85_01000 [Candidatus Daviesbacteria bacterium RIFCSPLOWO2_02_FULL_40_8]